MAVLRKCNNARENVLEAASFPLVPFVNRIRGGAFAFRGREIRLAAEHGRRPEPAARPGLAFALAGRERRRSERGPVVHHQPGEWPWEYRAEQAFALDENGLSLSLTCRNLSDEPMPCGLGQHPYFNCSAETRIDTQVTHAWTIDEHVLPVAKVPASGRFDLRDRAVCGQGLDHGFGGWGGSARMTDPAWPFDLELSSRTARFFQLYSPESGGIFVAEPVTHANAALNAPEAEWAELGLRVLEPGEAMSLDMRLDVIPKA